MFERPAPFNLFSTRSIPNSLKPQHPGLPISSTTCTHFRTVPLNLVSARSLPLSLKSQHPVFEPHLGFSVPHHLPAPIFEPPALPQHCFLVQRSLCLSLHPVFEPRLAFSAPRHPPAPIFKLPAPPLNLVSSTVHFDSLELQHPIFEPHLVYLVPRHPPTSDCRPPSTLSPRVTSTL
jgi:hypothetical protein